MVNHLAGTCSSNHMKKLSICDEGYSQELARNIFNFGKYAMILNKKWETNLDYDQTPVAMTRLFEEISPAKCRQI